jgi:hypothetical protein
MGHVRFLHAGRGGSVRRRSRDLVVYRVDVSVGIFVGNNIPKMSVLYVNILYTCTYTISQKSFVYVKILGH